MSCRVRMVLGLALLAGCRAPEYVDRIPEPAPSHSLAGRVLEDGPAGQGLAGARVAVFSATAPERTIDLAYDKAYTDPSGRFEVAHLDPVPEGSEVIVEVTRPGYHPARRTLKYRPDEVPPLTFRLQRQEGTRLELSEAVRRRQLVEDRRFPLVPEDVLTEARRTPEAHFYTRALLEPLSVTPNNGFHYLLVLPPVESTHIRRVGEIHADVSGGVYRSDFEESSGRDRAMFQGDFYQERTRIRLGLLRQLEARLNIPTATLSSGRYQIFRDGRPLMPLRTVNYGFQDLTVGVKQRIIGTGGGRADELAAAVDAKLPTGSGGNGLSSGSRDVILSALASGSRWGLRGHLQGGWFHAGDYDEVFLESLRIHDVAFGGVALACPVSRLYWPAAVILQVQGQTSAFRNIAPLDRSALTSHLGLRIAHQDLQIDAGGGAGLTSTATDWVGSLSISKSF